jgi:hypothetical protein
LRDDRLSAIVHVLLYCTSLVKELAKFQLYKETKKLAIVPSNPVTGCYSYM